MEVTKDNKGNIWIGERTKVGFKPIAVACLNVNKEEVCTLLVDTPFRRKGIATKILWKLEDIARKEGFKEINVCTDLDNIATQKLCEKLGYAKMYKFYKIFEQPKK